MAERTETVFHTPILHVQLHVAVAEDANPLVARREFLHVANIVIGLHPRVVDLIKVIAELLGLVTEPVPHRFNEHMNAQFAGQWNDLTDLGNGPFPDLVVIFVFPTHRSGDQQHRRSAHRFGFANGFLQSLATFIARGGVGGGQPFLPMLVVHHTVHRQAHLIAGLSQGTDVHARRTTLDAVEAQLLQLLHTRQVRFATPFN